MKETIIDAALLDDSTTLRLGDLCRACNAHAEWVIELVEEGILEVQGPDPSRWRFSCAGLRRARIVWRLQQDLGVNLAGAAVAVELLEELDALRRRLRVLESQTS